MPPPPLSLVEFIKSRIALPPGLPNPNPTAAAWQEPPHPSVANAQSPALPSTTDVAIIGSGITGCAVAYFLLKQSTECRVVVLEARQAVSGATGRNGGHLISDSSSLVPRMAEAIGKDAANEIARFSEANMVRVRELVQTLDAEDRAAVELREVVGSAAVDDAHGFSLAKQGMEMFKDICPEIAQHYRSFPAAKGIDQYKYNKNVAGVFETDGAATLRPYRLITAIFRQLLDTYADRFSLETNTPVQFIEHRDITSEAEFPYVVHTSRGRVQARKVIHCTNGFAGHLIPNLPGRLFPIRGTMSQQQPGPDFPNMSASVSWTYFCKPSLDPETLEFCSGLYYAQQDARTGAIFIGGERQNLTNILTSDDSVVADEARESLLSILPRIFDEASVGPVGASRVWSGILGFTSDGVPLVGKLTKTLTGRDGDGEWIAAGFNGHGMDKCWLTGEAVAKMVMGVAPDGLPTAFKVTEERFAKMSTAQGSEMFFASDNS